jgi:predicted metal-dependent peptidase
MPHRCNQGRFLISIVIDTSGSMSESLLGMAMREVDAIARMIDLCTVDIVQCDNQITSIQTDYRVGAKTELRGGGGTDMQLGIETALQLVATEMGETRGPPGLVIVMTDGYTPFPETRYGTPVIWCILGAPYGRIPEPWNSDDIVSVEE